MAVTAIEIPEAGDVVEIGCENADVARFHAVWPRDNALDATTRSPGSRRIGAHGNKRFDRHDLPLWWDRFQRSVYFMRTQ